MRCKGSTWATGTQGGMALIEALVAVFIFSIGLLGLVASQAAAVKAQGDAKKRADAGFIANQIAGDLWGWPAANLSACAGSFSAGALGCTGAPWGDRVEQSLPGGLAVVDVTPLAVAMGGAGAQITITLTWHTPGVSEEHRYVQIANITSN